MSDTIIKISQANSDEAYYELATSNPRHIDKIITHIQDTCSYLSDVPGAADITGSLNKLPELLEDETIRYTRFAADFLDFYELAPQADTFLVSQISSLFDNNYSNKSIKELTEFVNGYISGSITLEYQRLMDQLGLNVEDVADLVFINNLISSFKGLTYEEALQIIEKELVSIDESSLAAQMLESLKDSLVGNPVTIIDNVNTIFEEQIKSTTIALATSFYGKSITQAQVTEVMKNIDNLTAKLAAVDAEIMANRYIKEGGHTYARRETVLNHLADNEEFYNNLSAVQKARIDMAVKKAGTGIAIAIYAALIFYEGYQSRVIDGKAWDDTIEDMAVVAPWVIGGGALGSVVKAGSAKFLTSMGIGSVAGPIGMGAGFVASLIVGIGYDIVIKPKIKEGVETINDWWDEFCW